MRVAIIGARWADIDVECEVLGLAEDEVSRDPGTTMEGIVAAAKDAQVILSGPRARFDAATIDQLTGEGIVRYGVGYENIDVAAADRCGMIVAYVPDYGTEAVAFHTVALALAALRRIPMADTLVKAGTWDVGTVRPLHLPGALKVGVVGFGRIGRRAAGLFAGLGFGEVLAHDAFTTADAPDVTAVPLPRLLSDSDLVSLHASAATNATPLIGAGELALMKPGSILVNTARGSLIDPVALAEALRARRPALAALDVFSPEPPDLGPLAGVLDQVILTPHVAWYTEETERELRASTAEEAKRILEGSPVLHPVDAGRTRA